MNSESINKQVKILELDKILSALSEYASAEDAVNGCLEIVPEFNIKSVETLLAYTNDAYTLTARFGAPSFGGAKNVNGALTRAQMGGVLNLSDLLDIARLLHIIRSVKEWKEHFSSNITTSLDGFFFNLTPNKYFEDKIFSSIDSEEEMNDNASAKLADIRRKIKTSAASIREKLDRMIRSQSGSKYLQDAIVTQRDGRFVVPVKSEYRAEVPGLIHDTSSSGATLFIEPMAVVEVNNELRVLRNKEKDEIERILEEFSRETADFADNIKLSYNSVVELDIIFSKAKYAFDIKATLPQINDSGICVLKNARHPLLHKSAVPVSLTLGRDFDTLVITGPNTGGKTVTLKTIGLLTLMTMCGLMIPVDDGSKINIFGSIYADIGDEQSIEQSLSTFSSHMKNIVNILNNSSDNSLVLLDELCSGTDPVEGAALAKAIIMALGNKGAKVVTTTHYAELKAFALEAYRVENACCEFDVSTLKPTYKLLIGIPGRSNAFAISQKLGLEKSVIEAADSMVSEENKRFENVVSSLEEARQTAESERSEVEKIRTELEKQKIYHLKLREDIKKERENIISKARADAERILESANNKSDMLLNQLEDMKKKLNGDNAKDIVTRAREEARRAISSIEKDAHFVDKKQNDNYKLPRKLLVGDMVILVDIDKRARVASLPDTDGNLDVIAGIIKMRTNIKNLKLIESDVKLNGEKRKITRNVTGIKSRAERTVQSELDLRGMASDEALLVVDRFIDEALLTGIETIRIIHGKGTGVLRNAVQQELRANKSVRSFRLGVYGEGENGVTIVELK